jgi:uncharacterized membrane protein
MRRGVRYRRGGDGHEFQRLSAFVDGVFAISLTLLVVEVGVPETLDGDDADASALLDMLGDKAPLIAAFFLGCFVIGSYWAANHRFMARVEAIDGGFVGLTVVYLAFVALLPFPTGILGEFSSNPMSVVVFAVNLAAVSALEAALLGYAWRRDLYREAVPRDVIRWELTMSLAPVALFALSMPIAFLSTWAAVATWFGSLPVQAVLDRRRPPEAERYFP